MKMLYYDCCAGISGDMNMGALLDLGASLEYVEEGLHSLLLSGYDIRVDRESRRGIGGMRFEVRMTEPAHHHRTFEDIRNIITGSGLPEGVKQTSLEIFLAIARAESKIHGKDLNAVHFHEVGAIDSIIDIVGCVLCLENLGVTTIVASPVELGGGFVTCAHGTLPVPAPATMEILRGVPVTLGGVPHEATTPTGAAILKVMAREFTERLRFTPLKVGYGIGTRDTEIPNVLRVVLGETGVTAEHGLRKDAACVIECTVDDMNPELYGHIMDLLLKTGAFDVFMTPVVMKKSRPGVVLTVLCQPDMKNSVREIILAETTTFGVREYDVDRHVYERETTTVSTKYGPVRIKHALRDGKVIKSKPEYEDCRACAMKHGVSVLAVYNSLQEDGYAEPSPESGDILPAQSGDG